MTKDFNRRLERNGLSFLMSAMQRFAGATSTIFVPYKTVASQILTVIEQQDLAKIEPEFAARLMNEFAHFGKTELLLRPHGDSGNLHFAEAPADTDALYRVANFLDSLASKVGGDKKRGS